MIGAVQIAATSDFTLENAPRRGRSVSSLNGRSRLSHELDIGVRFMDTSMDSGRAGLAGELLVRQSTE